MAAVASVMFFMMGLSAGKAQAQFGVSDYLWALDNEITQALGDLKGQDGYIEVSDWVTAFVEGGEIVEWRASIVHGTY